MQSRRFRYCATVLTVLCLAVPVLSQKGEEKKPGAEKTEKSIGGEEHDANIYGVTIGMDIPTALEAVFVNAQRKPGQEKPDAMKKDDPEKSDIRVLYKNLPKGELQIVFGKGKYVRQIILVYAQPIQYSDLRLPYSGDVVDALGGQRYDDRYTIGYTDSQRIQGVWWRDEETADGYRMRIIFTSTNRLKESQFQFQKIMQKAIFITPGDESKFDELISKRP